MKHAILLLNELVADGVMDQYAIGGATAAMFYIEAVNTEDVDVFVIVSPGPSGLISLTSIYEAAKKKGAVEKGQYLLIGAWPVQILVPPNGLVEEALAMARETTFEGVPTRVMTAEHLCAVALQTGRSKDFLRVVMFLEQKAVDLPILKALVQKYNLHSATAKVPNWPA